MGLFLGSHATPSLLLRIRRRPCIARHSGSRIVSGQRWQSKAHRASGFSINNLVAPPETPRAPDSLARSADYRAPVQLEFSFSDPESSDD
jgi:hypothetical protein